MYVVNVIGLLSHFLKDSKDLFVFTTHLFTKCNLSGHTNYVPEGIVYHWTEDWRAGSIISCYAAMMASALL